MRLNRTIDSYLSIHFAFQLQYTSAFGRSGTFLIMSFLGGESGVESIPISLGFFSKIFVLVLGLGQKKRP